MNAPTLNEGMDFYIDAFYELGSERSIGFGEGPIPITAILRYAKHYDMTEEEESDLIFFIQALDICYLKYRDKKSKQSKK